MLGWLHNQSHQLTSTNASHHSKQVPLKFDTTQHLLKSGSGADVAGLGGITMPPYHNGVMAEKEREVPSTMYSVTRSVYLPRVALTKQAAAAATAAADVAFKGDGKNAELGSDGGGAGAISISIGINPLYIEEEDEDGIQADDEDSGNTKRHSESRNSRQSTPGSGEKSSSSGYGGSYGSSNEPYYFEHIKSKHDAISILAQNPNYVKSIRVGTTTTTTKQDRIRRTKPQNGTYGSGSSATTLSTIPEGQVDFTIPRPIWPPLHRSSDYDSLVDEAILLYTSLNYKPELARTVGSELSVKEVLTELLQNVNATIQGTNATTAEDMLKTINKKLESSLEALKNVTEEEMRLLCINLSNSSKVSSVLRAFSTNNSSASTSGNSSQCSPQWNCRVRTSSSSEELYHIPSGSSSSGFSDQPPVTQTSLSSPSSQQQVVAPVFVHDNIGSVSKGMRNALIYGTMCRSKQKTLASENKLLEEGGLVSASSGVEQPPKKSLLQAAADSKPSVWEQYYGAKPEGGVTTYVPKPSDVPLYPGGRPEADFTLDVPRSEMLSKRMKADKKWRCRCRVLTSFLGLVFFLLSVMAVSLMLTRGKRMFGSMV